MKLLKQILLTVVYIVVLSFVLHLNNIGFTWMISNIIAGMFEWFYNIHWFWKLCMIVFGGTFVIAFILNLFKTLTAIISGLLNLVFPYNKAMRIVSIILCLWNIIALEITFWPFLKFDFWIICMWLIISFFIVELNLLFVYKKLDVNIYE